MQVDAQSGSFVKQHLAPQCAATAHELTGEYGAAYHCHTLTSSLSVKQSQPSSSTSARFGLQLGLLFG